MLLVDDRGLPPFAALRLRPLGFLLPHASRGRLHRSLPPSRVRAPFLTHKKPLTPPEGGVSGLVDDRGLPPFAALRLKPLGFLLPHASRGRLHRSLPPSRVRAPFLTHKKPLTPPEGGVSDLVDDRGLEPLTSALRTQRSPS